MLMVVKIKGTKIMRTIPISAGRKKYMHKGEHSLHSLHRKETLHCTAHITTCVQCVHAYYIL